MIIKRWARLALGLTLAAGGMVSMSMLGNPAHAQVLLGTLSVTASGLGAMIALDAAIALLRPAKPNPRVYYD